MKDEEKVVESFDRALASLVARLPPEQRLAGLAPEQRLAGLAPEQRLAGLAPEQRVAGLTDAEAVAVIPEWALRGLSDEYVATLPRATRAAIKKRLAASTPAPRPPARRRKPRPRSA